MEKHICGLLGGKIPLDKVAECQFQGTFLTALPFGVPRLAQCHTRLQRPPNHHSQLLDRDFEHIPFPIKLKLELTCAGHHYLDGL